MTDNSAPWPKEEGCKTKSDKTENFLPKPTEHAHPVSVSFEELNQMMVMPQIPSSSPKRRESCLQAQKSSGTEQLDATFIDPMVPSTGGVFVPVNKTVLAWQQTLPPWEETLFHDLHPRIRETKQASNVSTPGLRLSIQTNDTSSLGLGHQKASPMMKSPRSGKEVVSDMTPGNHGNQTGERISSLVKESKPHVTAVSPIRTDHLPAMSASMTDPVASSALHHVSQGYNLGDANSHPLTVSLQPLAADPFPEFKPRVTPQEFGMGSPGPHFSYGVLGAAADNDPHSHHHHQPSPFSQSHSLTGPNTGVAHALIPANGDSQAAHGLAGVTAQVPARGGQPLPSPTWGLYPAHNLMQAPRGPRAMIEGNINRRITTAATPAQNQASGLGVVQQGLTPRLNSVGHSQSLTWKNPVTSELDEWLRVEANLLHHGLIKRIPGQRDGGSPFVPHNFEEWLEFRAGRAKDLRDEAAEKLRLRTCGSYMSSQPMRNKTTKIAPALGGKTYSDGLSVILAQPTMWSPWNQPSEQQPQACWPSYEEMKEEGDERHTSGFRRFLALPRIPGDETVVWKQKQVLHPLPFDRTWPLPNKDSVTEAKMRLPEDAIEEEMEALVGKSLMTAIDMTYLD